MQLTVILPALQRCLALSNTKSSWNCEHFCSVMEAEPLRARYFKRLRNEGGDIVISAKFCVNIGRRSLFICLKASQWPLRVLL